jgi:hypothetical protein
MRKNFKKREKRTCVRIRKGIKNITQKYLNEEDIEGIRKRLKDATDGVAIYCKNIRRGWATRSLI